MEASEIKKNGQLVKSWKQMDGSWYEDSYEIYKLGDKYYQIKDHVCISSSGTMSYWGKVTEVVLEGSLPTHIGLIISQQRGIAHIYKQRQGTPEDLSNWAVEVITNSKPRQKLVFKMVPLDF